MRSLLAFVTVLVALMAGCGGPASEPKGGSSAADPSGSASAPRYGALHGQVLNEEELPVPEAAVAISGTDATRETGLDGSFGFERLETGFHDVTVTHGDYVSQTIPVRIEADRTAELPIHLRLLPDRRPYNETLARDGRYDCGLEIPIYTGDCLIDVDPYENDGVTNEENIFPFTAGPRWRQIFIELTWTSGANNQLDGMHVYLAPGNETDPFGHHTKIAVAEGGQNPLRMLVTNGEVHPTAENYTDTHTPAVAPEGGGPLQVLVYPRGKLADVTGQVCDPDGKCFLGVGVGLDIRFTVYITTFYNEHQPYGFTAVPASA